MLDPISLIRDIKALKQRIGRVEPKLPGTGATVNECCCEPLTNGDPVTPEIIFADGDVVMVCGL